MSVSAYSFGLRVKQSGVSALMGLAKTSGRLSPSNLQTFAGSQNHGCVKSDDHISITNNKPGIDTLPSFFSLNLLGSAGTIECYFRNVQSAFNQLNLISLCFNLTRLK